MLVSFQAGHSTASRVAFGDMQEVVQVFVGLPLLQVATEVARDGLKLRSREWLVVLLPSTWHLLSSLVCSPIVLALLLLPWLAASLALPRFALALLSTSWAEHALFFEALFLSKLVPVVSVLPVLIWATLVV